MQEMFYLVAGIMVITSRRHYIISIPLKLDWMHGMQEGRFDQIWNIVATPSYFFLSSQ